MWRLTGQAARILTVLLHRLATLALLLLILGLVGGGMVAWRLAQGPVEIPWLAHRIENTFNADNDRTRLSIGTAALAWEGFREGVDRPLDIRLTKVSAIGASGATVLNAPRAELSLSLLALLRGRIQPRAIEIDGLRLDIVRTADGSVAISSGDLVSTTPGGAAEEPTPEGESTASVLRGFVRELARPAANDRTERRSSRLGQLRRVRIRDLSVTIVDRQLGATWEAAAPQIDFTRQSGGGVEGLAFLTLALGDQKAALAVSAKLAAGGEVTRARVRLSPVNPAALARSAPGLATLSALDAPVGVTADIDLGPQLALQRAQVAAQAGAGHARISASQISFLAASLATEVKPDSVRLELLRLELQPHEGGAITVVQATGSGSRESGGVRAELALGVDQVAFADLPRLWPEGLGGGARGWLTQNITAGIARNGHVDLALDANPDLSHVRLVNASGTLEGEGITLYWLRPIPPVDHAQAKLNIIDPDTIEITTQGGRQRQEGKQSDAGQSGIAVRSGRMRITGLIQPDQFGDIELDLAGTLPDTIALLKNPRLQLLSKHPVDLRDPAGQMTGRIGIKLPLNEKVQMDQIAIRAQAHLDGVHLTGIAAGRDLDQGVLDLDASNDAMKLNGRGLLANIPTQINADMDFRAGPPSQVLQRITVTGKADAKQLAAAGLDAGTALSGSASLQATLTERRDARGQLDVNADLTAAELTAEPLAWRKPAGSAAKGAARLLLNRDRLVGVDNILLEGDALSVRGRTEYANGSPSLLRLERIVLGGTDAQGTVRFPQSGDRQPIEATFSGRSLDLSTRMSHHRQAAGQPANAQNQAGQQPWTVDARFDRAIAAAGRPVTAIVLHVEDDGDIMRRLHLQGRTVPNGSFRLDIAPDRSGRRLTGDATDAGELLRAFDIMDTMQGGRLTVSGNYNDTRADHPLSGSAQIEDFRIRNAPGLARVLQAMTLYGLVQLAQGPGLGFTRAIAPFTLAGNTLTLGEARAFNPSLGLTAKGQVDLARDQADLEGTIVPAYFFNSLLGRVPLVGKLFSPEQGGGVFAARYTVRGPLADPQVSVNPLSALTPGFLRGLFGTF
ncbi:MAG: hypothetical protein JOZ58_12315 [Acetobacteraceae bacterium]|nr:hypothetical protein [Acetobacteraceae bacterium]